MGGASSQSVLCYRVAAQNDIIITWAVIGCNNVDSWIFRNKHEATKMFCKIFSAAKTF